MFHCRPVNSPDDNATAEGMGKANPAHDFFLRSNARFRDRTSFAKDCQAKEHLRSLAHLERTGPLQPVVRQHSPSTSLLIPHYLAHCAMLQSNPIA